MQSDVNSTFGATAGAACDSTPSPMSRPGKKSLTLASPLGSLQPMRGPFRTGATVRRAVISERTVSRYLHGRPPKRSQTWRTFFTNHWVTSARQQDRQPRFAVTNPDVSSLAAEL